MRYKRCTLCWTAHSAYFQEVSEKSVIIIIALGQDQPENLSNNSLGCGDCRVATTEMPGCVSYMFSVFRADPRSQIRRDRWRWRTHHRACLDPGFPGAGSSRHCSEWPDEENKTQRAESCLAKIEYFPNKHGSQIRVIIAGLKQESVFAMFSLRRLRSFLMRSQNSCCRIHQSRFAREYQRS